MEKVLAEVKVFSFDIDGTLLDSYTYMRDVLQILLLYIGVPAGMLEMVTDDVYKSWYDLEKRGVFDYGKMHLFLEEFARKYAVPVRYDVKEFQDLLLEARVKGSEPYRCAVKLLSELKERGKIVVSVSGGDGVPGMKRRRIEEGVPVKLFDKILVVPEDAPSRVEALNAVREEFGVSNEEVLHVDDRPQHAAEAYSAGFKAMVVKTGFYDPYFRLPDGVLVVDDLCAVLDALSKL